jgi:hypothetical protein
MSKPGAKITRTIHSEQVLKVFVVWLSHYPEKGVVSRAKAWER